MTEKKNRDTLGTRQIHSTKQYWKVEGGCKQIFFFFFLLEPTIILNKYHSIYQHRTCSKPPTHLLKNLIVVKLTVWPWRALLGVTKLRWASGPLGH